MLIVCGSVSADDLVLDKDVKAVQFDASPIEFVAYQGADSIDLHTPIETHPLNLTLHEIRETITDICSDTSLTSDEKLQAQTEVLGMDARLKAWLEADRDEETGEPIYSENIPIITPIFSFFGLAKETPAEPYTQAEGEAAYRAYLDRYIVEYKPTGLVGDT